jgi:hypothetical protein
MKKLIAAATSLGLILLATLPSLPKSPSIRLSSMLQGHPASPLPWYFTPIGVPPVEPRRRS